MTEPIGRCRTCGGRPARPVDAAHFGPTAAATRRLAEQILADLPPDRPEVIATRRAQLAAAAAGRPEPDVTGTRPRLVHGVWRWSAA